MTLTRRERIRFGAGLALAIAGVVCARVPAVLTLVCAPSVALHIGRFTALGGLIVIMLALRARAAARQAVGS